MNRPSPGRLLRHVGALVAILMIWLPAAAAAAPPSARPAGARVELSLQRLQVLHGRPVTVPGRRIALVGVVRPYVAGQRVLLSATVAGHEFTRQVLAIRRFGAEGRFEAQLRAPRPGHVRVLVSHAATPGQVAFAISSGYMVISERTAPGARGPIVQLVQQRLAALHFYIPQTGVYDLGTELAVDAYHRMLGWGTSDLITPATITALLNHTGSFHVRFPGQGRHVEGDLSDQLLALIDHRNVEMIFPISSGKPSTPTVLGSWRIYLRDPGYLPDGMYYSDFFYSGYAVHGYDPAPNYPASHGCMRLPIVDAITVFNWLAIGDWVDTYYAGR
jgi:hypothetical protein